MRLHVLSAMIHAETSPATSPSSRRRPYLGARRGLERASPPLIAGRPLGRRARQAVSLAAQLGSGFVTSRQPGCRFAARLAEAHVRHQVPLGGSRFHRESGRTGGPRGQNFFCFEISGTERRLRSFRAACRGSNNRNLADLPSSIPLPVSLAALERYGFTVCPSRIFRDRRRCRPAI